MDNTNVTAGEKNIEQELDVEVDVDAQGPKCELCWDAGQAILRCETQEDAETAAILLAEIPVKVEYFPASGNVESANEPDDQES